MNKPVYIDDLMPKFDVMRSLIEKQKYKEKEESYQILTQVCVIVTLIRLVVTVQAENIRSFSVIWIDGSSGANSAVCYLEQVADGFLVSSKILLPIKGKPLGNNRTEFEAFLWSTACVSCRPLTLVTDSLYVVKHGRLPRVNVNWNKGHSNWQMDMVDIIAKLTALTNSVYYKEKVNIKDLEDFKLQLRMLRDSKQKEIKYA